MERQGHSYDSEWVARIHLSRVMLCGLLLWAYFRPNVYRLNANFSICSFRLWNARELCRLDCLVLQIEAFLCLNFKQFNYKQCVDPNAEWNFSTQHRTIKRISLFCVTKSINSFKNGFKFNKKEPNVSIEFNENFNIKLVGAVRKHSYGGLLRNEIDLK